MLESYTVVVYKVDIPRYRDAKKTRYKVVVYDAKNGKRVNYLYNDDPQVALRRLRKKLPFDAQVDVRWETEPPGS